ncbi:MAG: BtrH N-terminal domain-containing protein [Chitinophagaceae bacterium]|nr:BtrH N-terminal domain-containing protein [Chitinophagaceae bacterium]
MIIPFKHQSQAHCESGVTSNLLKHYGLPISEPLAFGIGSGIFFGHLPFVKVNGVPGTTYRIYPGQIFKNVCKRLNVQYESVKFKNATEAMAALKKNIDQNIPTGCQVSVFFLPFLPEVFRFHFNAHNLIVYGEENNKYFISDPVMEDVTEIAYEDLARARFAKGYPEPKGRMYFIRSVSAEMNLTEAIKKGIKQTCFFMSSPPVPWFGVNAIKFLSKKISQYPEKLDARKATLYLGNIIRMQEEIGTGGAGFRFLYAAFLQEASVITGLPELKAFSERMTLIGDQWRNFAYQTARICKSRTTDVGNYQDLAVLLMGIYEMERAFFAELKVFNQTM